MGAVTFSIDRNLVVAIQSVLHLENFVETGTFEGDSVAAVEDLFQQIFTVESSEEYYNFAVARFKEKPSVDVRLGDSPELIEKWRKKTSDSALFWLDAHWCLADSASGKKSQCPLLAELEAIGSLSTRSVVMIDDARLFMSAPPKPHEITHWPTFTQVLRHLNRLSDKHLIMIINDAIIFYPEAIEETLRSYAHENSIDWLNVLHASREYDEALASLHDKDRAIHDKEAALRLLTIDLHEKDASLKEKESALMLITSDLHLKDSSLREKNSEINTKEAALLALTADLRAKNVSLSEKDSSLREKDAEITSKEAAIVALTADLHAKESMLFEKDSSLREKDAEITSKEAAIVALTADIHAKDAALSQKDLSLEEKDAEITAKQAALLSLTDQLYSKDASLEEKENALLSKERALQDLTRKLIEKDSQANIIHRAAEALRDILEQRQELINSQAKEITQLSSAAEERLALLLESKSVADERLAVIKALNEQLQSQLE